MARTSDKQRPERFCISLARGYDHKIRLIQENLGNIQKNQLFELLIDNFLKTEVDLDKELEDTQYQRNIKEQEVEELIIKEN